MRLISNISESRVVTLWQRLLRQGTELITEGGELIKIIYPGRINKAQGADFRDAVITTNQGLIKGDIEIHVKSSGWHAHRHHQNPAYNQVILHVVMWHNTEGATNLQNGESAPILALAKYIKEPINQRLTETEPPPNLTKPCLKATECLTTGIVAKSLDSAGEERFSTKAAKFQSELAQIEASQCLYQGIMGALGYSANKLPFLELAHRVPLQTLESITRDNISDEECLARQQALLLGTAGLLPAQRRDGYQKSKSDDNWIGKLERLWDSFHPRERMPPHAWHLFRVRPNNSPIRRLAAMSYLILRYREKGIFDGVIDMVKEVPVGESRYRLEKGLVVTTDGYWASHFDFDSVSRITNPTLLGSSRADDIITNVLLPFAFAWGELTSHPELKRKTLALYRHYPKLAVNAIERHMKSQLGVNSSLVNSAQRQQGLIHIYHTLCAQGRCNRCPLNHLETRDHIQV